MVNSSIKTLIAKSDNRVVMGMIVLSFKVYNILSDYGAIWLKYPTFRCVGVIIQDAMRASCYRYRNIL